VFENPLEREISSENAPISRRVQQVRLSESSFQTPPINPPTPPINPPTRLARPLFSFLIGAFLKHQRGLKEFLSNFKAS
jgi:hypothetical protein